MKKKFQSNCRECDTSFCQPCWSETNYTCPICDTPNLSIKLLVGFKTEIKTSYLNYMETEINQTKQNVLKSKEVLEETANELL